MTMPLDCPICALHRDINNRNKYEISWDDLWVLCHHPVPAQLMGWLPLDSLLRCLGPIDFLIEEVKNWGISRSRCEYFGEKNNPIRLGLYNRFWRVSPAPTSSSNTSIYYQSQHKALVSGWPLSACWFKRIFTGLWRTITKFCSEWSTNQGNIIELFMKPLTRGLRVNCL